MVREDPGNHRPASRLHRTIMEIILRTTESHLKNNVIIRHSQCEFTKSFKTNLITCEKITHLLDKEKMLGVIFLDFSKASGQIIQLWD